MPYKDKPTVKHIWRIGEVAALAKIAQHSIRFYESQFSWLKPNYSGKDRGKFARAYTLEGVNNVLEVVHLIDYGISIRGINKAYNDKYLTELLEFFGWGKYDPENWTPKNKAKHDTDRKD